MGKIFISYRRDDSRTITGRIIDRLRARMPYVEIFKDVDSIPTGVNFVEWMSEHLDQSEVFVPIIGKDWASSLMDREQDSNDYVRIEVEQAIQNGLTIIPVYVNNAEAPRTGDVPESVAAICTINGLPVRRDPDFDPDMEKLIDVLKANLWSHASIAQRGQILLKRADKKMTLIGISAIAIILLVSWIVASSIGGSLSCGEHRVATHIANFKPEGTAALTNTALTKLEGDMPDSSYSFHEAGYVDRQTPDYHQHIRHTYFTERCDTIGLFVNGLLLDEDKIFNFYCTNSGLKMVHPDYLDKNEIALTTPEDIEFDTDADAAFVADFVNVLLGQYTYKDKKRAIEASYLFQQKYDITEKSQQRFGKKSILGPLYFFRGHQYAMEGNDERARQYYKKAARFGNEDIQRLSKENDAQVQPIVNIMYNDPELKLLRAENVQAHGKIESKFAKFLREFFQTIGNLFKGIKLGR